MIPCLTTRQCGKLLIKRKGEFNREKIVQKRCEMGADHLSDRQKNHERSKSV